MTKTRLLILTNEIPTYRVPVYDALARVYDLTVAHSGPPLGDPNRAFAEERLATLRFGSLRFQLGAWRLAKRADCVVTLFDVHWISSMLLARCSRGSPVVLWGHGLGRHRLGQRIRRSVAQAASGILLYDARGVDALVAAGIPREKVFVAPNTIAVPRPLPPDPRRVRTRFLFVGRLQARKRVDLLIRAFGAALADLPSGVGIEIVGEGEEGSALRRLAAELGLTDRVDFAGEIRDDDMLRKCFERAIAYVSPAALGVGVLHAFAHAVPVVTCATEGHGPEAANVCPEVNGLVLPLDESALSIALRQLATEPARVEALAEAAYHHYWEERSLPRMVDGFAGAVESVLET